ncbi:MAG: tetratricopeptide repeat protein [Pirellulales bacterium]
MHRFWFALLFATLTLNLSSDFSLAQPPSSGAAQQEEKRDPKVVQIESLADRANQLIRDGKFDQALDTGDEAVKVDDKSALAHVIRGRAFNAQRQFDKAIEAFDAALSQPNRDRDAQNYRSQAYAAKSFSLYEQGKYLPAVDSAYLGTLEKYDNVDCHMNRGRAYLARREWDKAINSYNRVIGIDAKSAEAYSHRGYAYANKDNFDQCINDQTKAIELDAKCALAFQRRAGAQINKKKLPEALKDLEQSLQMQPNLAEALCDRAILMAANKNAIQAENDLEAALRSDPRCVRAYVLKSQQLVIRERYAEAINVLDRAAAEVPGQEVVLLLRAERLYRARKTIRSCEGVHASYRRKSQELSSSSSSRGRLSQTGQGRRSSRRCCQG